MFEYEDYTLHQIASSFVERCIIDSDTAKQKISKRFQNFDKIINLSKKVDCTTADERKEGWG